MTEKQAHERVDYLERKLAYRLMKMTTVLERVDFMMQIFGRQGRDEYIRLTAIYPELMG